MASKLIVLLAVVCFTGAVVDCNDITDIEADGAQLITVGQNFAEHSPALEGVGIETIYVNGGAAVIYSSRCDVVDTTVGALPQNQANAVDTVYSNLIALESGDFSNVSKVAVASFSLSPGSGASSQKLKGVGVSTSSSNGDSKTTFGDLGYSVTSTSDFPAGLSRVFFSGDIVTFVYTDTTVKSIPEKCLNSDDKAFVDSLQSQQQESQEIPPETQEKLQGMLANLPKGR